MGEVGEEKGREKKTYNGIEAKKKQGQPYSSTLSYNGVADDLRLEPQEHQQGHRGKHPQTAHDLEPDLVRQEAGVAHHVVVEYEGVGEVGEDEVEEVDAD